MFIERTAEGEHYALLTMDAIESAGATVVAITPRKLSPNEAWFMTHCRYSIWAKARDNNHAQLIDKAINVKLNETPLHP